jgi:hypothetical protein
MFGIDLGNDSIIISQYKNNIISVIEHDNNRKLKFIVSTNNLNSERFIGNNASHKLLNPDYTTIINSKYLLMNNNYNLTIYKTYVAVLNYFSHLTKNNTINITIPYFFNNKQIQFYHDICKICKIKYNIIDEHYAVALYYGLNRYNTSLEKSNILFIDLGSIHSTIYFVSFSENNCSINYINHIKYGGFNINKILYDYFTYEILDNYNFNIHSSENNKYIIKLFNSCEKIKKTLSISNIAYEIIDLPNQTIKLSLTREKFNKLIQLFINKLINLFNKKKLIDIHSIEILGGTSRIPIIQEIIKQYYQMTISTTLNLDETVSKGAAYYNNVDYKINNIDKSIELTNNLNNKQIQELQNYESNIIIKNDFIIKLKKYRNDFEKYTIQIKNELLEYILYINNDEHNQLINMIDSNLNNLNSLNINKIDDLQKNIDNKINHIKNRKYEYENRDKYIKLFYDTINIYNEKADHIEDLRKQADFIVYCNDIVYDFDLKIFKKYKPTDDPEYTINDIKEYINNIKNKFNHP